MNNQYISMSTDVISGQTKVGVIWMENGIDGFYQGGGLPLGFAMLLAQNATAMDRYSKLTEAEKEKLILRAKASASEEETRTLIEGL